MASTVKDTDRGYKAFKKRIASLKGASVAVGITKEVGDQAVGTGFTMAGLAAVHEFGSSDGRIPERSFIRSTMDLNRRRYEKELDKAVETVIKKKQSPKQALFPLGEQVRGDIVKRIQGGEITPPLAESTIARKGSDIPLLDTGRLVNAIRSEVKEK